MEAMIKHIETLIEKAAEASKNPGGFDSAMRLSQAALNAAHAIQVMEATKQETERFEALRPLKSK
jgi:hypothetical protein